MRGCLIAPPGKKLLAIDLAQIEARILLWFVEDWGTLRMIAEGASPYEAHARATMGWKGGPLKAENPGLYKLAKARVLGLGYGCGAVKFVAVAKIMAGLDLTPEEAARTVKEYRAANPEIVKLWRTLGDAFAATVPGATYRLKLPVGRSILYRNCHPAQGTAEQIKGAAVKIYGGLLCENLVQATARDLFADRLLALEAAGFRAVLLVHDEYVLEVEEAGAAEALRTAMEIVRKVPAWAARLPVDCEGHILERYAK
jgi:DNA polymerase